jgi:hypothetical protein
MPPCGAAGLSFLPLNGLNFAILAMVAPRFAATLRRRAQKRGETASVAAWPPDRGAGSGELPGGACDGGGRRDVHPHPRGFAAVQESSGMARWQWIGVAGLLALAAACRENRAPLGLLAEKAAGGWRRTSLVETPVSDAPDPVPRSAVTRLETAEYEGPGKLEVRLYELTSPEDGVTLAQRWRPSADTVFFNGGRFFVVIKWEQAEREALRSFVRELQGKLHE